MHRPGQCERQRMDRAVAWCLLCVGCLLLTASPIGAASQLALDGDDNLYLASPVARSISNTGVDKRSVDVVVTSLDRERSTSLDA